MATKVTRKKTASTVLGADEVADVLAEYLALEYQQNLLTKRVDELKKALKSTVEVLGYTDDKGSLYVELDEPVVGPDGKEYSLLKNERRVIQSINTDRAETLVKSKGLEKQCIILVPTLDENEILKAHYEGDISQEEIDSIFDTRENFAFRKLEG